AILFIAPNICTSRESNPGLYRG
ncbi:hypothetical protein Goari_014806, partial [Gossypium aridum]|nr:hypothetical protein [Gossypium aridum]